MEKAAPKYPRILAVAPSTDGFGFALIEGLNTLVDWGVKSITGDKNTGSIAKVKAMIAYYEPDVLVIENTSIRSCRRSGRIRALSQRISRLAERRGITVTMFSPAEVKRAFLVDNQESKYAVAETIAKRFPDELGFRLPPKRRPWENQDSRMDIFAAVALALMVR
jgi:hypothetical protein